jgi:hypothetical protein
MTFTYTLYGVGDVDQQWSSAFLPGHGGMFCVPAAFVNWMYFLAAQRPALLPFTSDQDDHIRRNLAVMGDYMKTDHKGRVFVSDNRRIATFDAEGVRVPGAMFDGLAAGPLLKVARSNCPLDPERSRRTGWRN